MKDVIINIKGKQKVSDMDEDIVEMTTVGRMGTKDGKTFLSYDDSTSMGVKGVTTIVKIESNSQVVLQRTGSVHSRLLVEKGQRNLCHYATPQGDIMVGIFGEIIKNNLNEHGGEIFMSYTIDVNMGMLSQNEISISVKEVENNVNAGS